MSEFTIKRYVGLLDETGNEPPEYGGYSRVLAYAGHSILPNPNERFIVNFHESTRHWGIISEFFVADETGAILCKEKISGPVDVGPFTRINLTFNINNTSDYFMKVYVDRPLNMKACSAYKQPRFTKTDESENNILNIDKYTHWTLDKSPWKISKDIVISEHGTLKIDPGVVLDVSPGVSITINGGIFMDGVVSDIIPIFNISETSRGYIQNCNFGYKSPRFTKTTTDESERVPLRVPFRVLSEKSNEEEPKNNDGRAVCFWCGSNTVTRFGLTSKYDICEVCER